MWSEIKKILISLLWPVIKEVLKKTLREFLDWLVKKIKYNFERRNQNGAEQANSKAEEAEGMASYAKTKEEAERYQAVANVWHEVAEMFRRENDAMKQELEKLKQQANAKAEDAVESMNFEEVIDASGEEFKSIEGRHLLRLDDSAAE
jgi:hypothetical protein